MKNLKKLKFHIKDYVEGTFKDLIGKDTQELSDFLEEEPIDDYGEIDWAYIFGVHGFCLPEDDYEFDWEDEGGLDEEEKSSLINFIKELYEKNWERLREREKKQQ